MCIAVYRVVVQYIYSSENVRGLSCTIDAMAEAGVNRNSRTLTLGTLVKETCNQRLCACVIVSVSVLRLCLCLLHLNQKICDEKANLNARRAQENGKFSV